MGSTQQLHDVILLNSFAWVLGLIVNSTETKMVLIGNLKKSQGTYLISHGGKCLVII